MRIRRSRFVVVIATAALALALLSGFGAAPALASGRPDKTHVKTPDSCFWFNDASQSRNFYATSGQVAGYYEVVEEHYSCIPSWHRAYGTINITLASFPCTQTSFYVDLYANYVHVEDVEGAALMQGSGESIGGDCATAPQNYGVATSTYINSSFAYCAKMTQVDFGGPLNDLKAGSDCS